VSWSGEAFQFRSVPVVPKPTAPPPVVVACTSAATEAMAAARGLPMLLGMHVGDLEKTAALSRYSAALQKGVRVGGGDAPGHIATGLAYVADSRTEAVATLTRELPRWLGPGLAGYVPVDGRPRPARDPAAYARRLCELHAVGTPDDCVDSLVTTIERTGIRHLILLVEAGGDPLENIRRLGTEVLPRIHSHFRSR
jgi:alkanesulfonate monooxygenase SsuD/methylene tetrahydromethanopterin reductase-like flavin-dependent oxidoreductase (luciferase family)